MATRIALVTQGFHIGGGVPAVTRWLWDGLRNNGYSVEVHDLATSRRDPFSSRIVSPASWARGTRQGHVRDGVQSWGANFVEIERNRYLPRSELTKKLREYDLIQVVCGGPALAGAALEAGRPVAVQVATRARWERASISAASKLLGRALMNASTASIESLERRAMSRANVIMTENNFMFRESSRFNGNVIKAPPGIDTDFWCPDTNRRWSQRGPIVVLGRLGEARKGLDRVVAAYEILCSRNPKVPELVLGGRGEVSETVAKMISKSPVRERIHVRRDLTRSEMVELNRTASVFWQSSHEEGLGVAVIEAMACGAPVVATETAGTLESVVPGMTGFLVAQGSRREVSIAMAEATEHVFELGMEQSESARHRAVSEFSTPVCIKRYTDAYERISNTLRA